MRRRYPHFRGRRIEASLVESDFEYFIAGFYVGNYLLHFMIMSFVICIFQTKLTHCIVPMNYWLEISGFFYLIATIMSMSLVIYMRKRGEMIVQVIDLVILECVFFQYSKRSLPFMILIAIDLIHAFFTIRGSNMFFEDLG
jgi:hypothetical protein